MHLLTIDPAFWKCEKFSESKASSTLFLSANNIWPPCPTSFYIAQSTIIYKLLSEVQFAREQVITFMDAPLSAELHSPTFRVSCSKKHPMKSHLVTIVSLSFLCHPGFLVTQKWVINVSHWAEWVLFLFLLFGTPFYRGISVKCGILCFWNSVYKTMFHIW